MTKLVIFDLDGTLVDAYSAINASFNHAMKSIGMPRQDAITIRRAVGWGDKLLLAPFVKKKDLGRALLIYRKHHARSLLQKARLIPGAKAVLNMLKKNNIRLAVASNRPKKFSLILIRRLGLKRYFDYVLCADEVKKGKPHPQILRHVMKKLAVGPESTLYVGDMTIDAVAGRRAGVRTIIVTGGSSLPHEIRKERPWRIIKKIKELSNIV